MNKLKFPVLTAILALVCALPSAAQDADELQTDEVQSAASQADEVQSDDIQADAPKVAAPKAAAPKADAPKAAAPKAAAPKADAPKAAAPPATTPQSSAGVVEAEWNFLKTAGQDKEEDVLKLALPQLEDWLARNPETPNSAEAQLLKANLRVKLGDYQFALIDLVKYFQAYPQAASLEEALKLFADTLSRKGDKKTRPALKEASQAPETAAADYNISSMLEKLSVQAGEAYYEPLTAEFRNFFNRFPGYVKNDALRVALADLHQRKGEYLPARLEYEKMIQLHPASPLLARAKRSLGGLLADNMKEYEKAIEVYQDIAASLPGTDEAWTAYSRLPALAEKQKKYGLAVEIYEKIIELYPDRDETYNSYKDAARVLREKLDKFPEAVAVLNRLADKYKGQKAIEALMLAAEIYRKDIKDAAGVEGEVKMYDRIVAEYGTDPQAPKALYAAGEVYEKAKDTEKAKEYYQKVIEKYAETPLRKKAENRITALSKQ
ncbi:MAG: tetratricopeptide repeat protein [Elusimicrobiota bacterium]|nr:tetratricopeptide repeat protein [Elusimicrobiota bacterium]